MGPGSPMAYCLERTGLAGRPCFGLLVFALDAASRKSHDAGSAGYPDGS